MADLYIGLMSGTSVDSIDAVLMDFSGEASATPVTVASHGHDIPAAIRDAILALCSPGPTELDRAGQLDCQLGQLFAEATLALLDKTDIPASAITAIGSHGQTVRHRPPGTIAQPFSLQLGDPNTIACLTGITTIADFRRRDMALGGQGAPLMPAFHQAVFASDRDRAVVNIGGMANITELAADGRVAGYDTGPGNAVLDYWVRRKLDQPFDRDGAWAAGGEIIPALLERLLAESYFSLPAPKSTGRETFNGQWLEAALLGLEIRPEDVQATLSQVTAKTIADAVAAFSTSGELLVCGGGARNADLLTRMERLLPNWQIADTGKYGIDADWLEAAGFAWLARQTMNGAAGNCPDVTGASQKTVLGGIYPA